MTGDRKPMVQIASPWERTSKNGNQYFSGFMGSAQLLMFRGEEITQDNGDVVQTWNLLVQERDQAPRQSPTRPVQRGRRAWDRSCDAGRGRAAGEAVVAAAGRDRTPEPPADSLDDSAKAIRDLAEGPR